MWVFIHCFKLEPYGECLIQSRPVRCGLLSGRQDPRSDNRPFVTMLENSTRAKLALDHQMKSTLVATHWSS